MKLRGALVIVPFALLLSTATAEHCATWTTSTSDGDTIVVDLGPGSPDFRYLVDDTCNVPRYDPESDGVTITGVHGEEYHVPGPVSGPTCLYSIWLYYETNGLPGLQRGDQLHDDTCQGLFEADILFY